MNTRHLFFISIIAVCLSLTMPAPTLAKELEDRKWLRVQTENFEIYSLRSKNESIEIAHYLEAFRYAARSMLGVDLSESPLATKIFLISGRSAAKEFDVASYSAGFFQADLRTLWIINNEIRGRKEIDYLLHTYTHFLLQNFGHERHALWFSEGIAEYLGALRIRDKDIVLGGAPESARPVFRGFRRHWTHMQRVIARQRDEMWSDTGDELYFAESWALVHYMLNSPEYSPTFSQRATEYSRNIATGMDPVTTFKSVFGVGANTLNQDVWEYIINSQPAGVSIPLESALPAFQADVSQMSHNEITQALREYRLAQGEETIEHSDISDAVEHSPNNAHRQLDMANSLYQQALAAQPSERDALITLAKSHYLKAQELDATQVEFYAMYGQTLLLEGRNTDLAVVMLEEARRLLPSSTVILRALAQGYRATDQKDEAVNLDHLAEKYESESAVAKHTHRILEF